MHRLWVKYQGHVDALIFIDGGSRDHYRRGCCRIVDLSLLVSCCSGIGFILKSDDEHEPERKRHAQNVLVPNHLSSYKSYTLGLFKAAQAQAF